jgi:uncharacterized protein (DUF2062 family)
MTLFFGALLVCIGLYLAALVVGAGWLVIFAIRRSPKRKRKESAG